MPLPAVRLPAKYYAFLSHFGAPDNPEDLPRTKALLDDLARLRSTTCDWAYPLYELVRRARIAETGELLTAAAWAGRVDLQALPRLDLSAFDPWVAASAARGMTRFEINVDSVNTWREQTAIREATGRDLDPNTEDGWKVVLWLYSELRRYALSRGMESTWAKVDDEIPPEQIPTWIAGARRFQSIGYRTYTTVTGSIPRNEAWMNAMNPASDGWQTSIVTSRDFLTLTRQPLAYTTYRRKVDLRWGLYTNGGAKDTWATLQRFFPEPELVDQIEVWANGQKMRWKGGSGWGNQERGVAMEYGGHLYISLPDGGNPNQALIEVAYRVRQPVTEGPPAVQLDKTDEVWVYGGRTMPHRDEYTHGRRYGWLTLALNVDGYGYWTYYWWQPEHRLVWYDEQTGVITHSPAYEGLRDGNEDAAYVLELKRRTGEPGVDALAEALWKGAAAPLRLEERKDGPYVWDDISADYAAFNLAKREVLRRLAALPDTGFGRD
ncbi:MAG: hypothetical protein C4289_11430 [Chloroflexota bacterium]